MDQRAALRWALHLAHLGFQVFPLSAGAKTIEKGFMWSSEMTTDAEKIRQWFDTRPGMNYGVCAGADHVVVDLDQPTTLKPDKKDGIAVFNSVQAAEDIDDWATGNTFCVESPSGGRHMYFNVREAVANAHRFPPGIDIRGFHGYVVGPGSVLVEGQCKDTDTPGSYEVVDDLPVLDAPPWIMSRLKKNVGESPDRVKRKILVDLDTLESLSQAKKFLEQRKPAVEGEGGDHHTLMTAMRVIDFGVSEETCLELMQPWNDKCDPPWEVTGAKGTLEEKIKNAWKYREDDVGLKAGGGFGDDDSDDIEAIDSDAEDISDMEDEQDEGIRSHIFRGGQILNRKKRREMIIPEWLPAHGLVAALAKRGGGKTVILLDIALRLACNMDWHGMPTKSGLTVVYICDEDDVVAEEQIRAWGIKHGVDEIPDTFIFLDIITDLMSSDDTQMWAEILREEVGADNRAVVFLDTWQRASSRGGQSDDGDMQTAVHHAEALARSLKGPIVAAFHPPKSDESIVMGSSIIENSTTAIWTISDHPSGGIKLEVTRMKGKGEDNYKLFKFQEVGIGEMDEFDRELSGIVPVSIGGVEHDRSGEIESMETARVAFAKVLRELEKCRKDDNPDSNRPYSVSDVSKRISGFKADKKKGRASASVRGLISQAQGGDLWAKEMVTTLRSTGNVNFSSWQRVNDRILGLFSKDPRGHDFGDGFVLKLVQDGKARRVKIEKGGICS